MERDIMIEDYADELDELVSSWEFWKMGVGVMDQEMADLQLDLIRARLKIICKELDVEYREPK